MKVEYRKLEELAPYENNPRINDDAVQYVANSIKKFGFKVPLVISKDGVIITGHTRYKASLELGLKEVPCVIADDLTEKQQKAFRLADNKVSEFSQWNDDLLDIELEDLDIDMSEFGFLEKENINLDHFFEENTKQKETKKETIICPYCNKEIIL